MRIRQLSPTLRESVEKAAQLIDQDLLCRPPSALSACNLHKDKELPEYPTFRFVDRDAGANLSLSNIRNQTFAKLFDKDVDATGNNQVSGFTN